MALKYTGMADPFVFHGKEYRPGQNVPISKADALHHMQASKLHTFEDDGEMLEVPAGPQFVASPVTGATPTEVTERA